MTLQIDASAARRLEVDRDGTSHDDHGNQGFRVYLGDLTIHFMDENDAVDMARAILKRMGEE